MQLDKLKIGALVECPVDRGDNAYVGEILSIGKEVYKNINGNEFVWVEVQGPNHKTVWPSNRLG